MKDKSDKRHFVALVRKDRLSLWKFLALQKNKEGKRSYLYGSKDYKSLSDLSKAKGTLWVIGTQNPHPPSLIAKLKHVKLVGRDIDESQFAKDLLDSFTDDEGIRYRAIVCGDPERSHFYPQNDARPALEQFIFKNSKRPLGTWHSSYGMKFQRPRRISQTSVVNEFMKLEKDILKQPVFLSWKHKDHSQRKVEKLVRALIQNERYSVWWDQIALPYCQHALKQFEDRDALLDQLLRDALDDSGLFLALASTDYGKKTKEKKKAKEKPKKRRLTKKKVANWTLREWNRFVDRQPRSIAVYPSHGSFGAKRLREEHTRRSKAAMDLHDSVTEILGQDGTTFSAEHKTST